ncbi:MAG: LysM domain-containing protein [Acidimicrobiales bacterium]
MAAIAYSPVRTAPVAHPHAVYRRRRAMVATVVAALAFVAVVLAMRITAAPSSPRPIASQVVVVQPGDTLWSIAGRFQNGGDIRPLVDRLEAEHGPGALRIGERLAVPG